MNDMNYCKIIKLFALILILAPAQVAHGQSINREDVLLIASFNIKDFGIEKRTQEQLKEIASLFRDFDIIALQEIKDSAELDKVVGWTEKNYRYLLSRHKGASTGETLAFVYDADRVELTGPARALEEEADFFDVDPHWAPFRVRDLDVTVVNFHSVYDKAGEKTIAEDVELVRLAREFIGEPEKNLILLGDFNLPPDHEAFNGLEKLGFKYLIPASTITHLGLKSSTDNIWINEPLTLRYAQKAGTDRPVLDIYEDYKPPYSTDLSDHVVVWAAFYVR